MELELKGCRALVTGGSRGIGLGIVKALAGEGAHVVFCGLDAARGETTAATLRSEGHNVRFLQADMESEGGIDTLAETVLAQGAVDILVNNVGGAHDPEAGSRPFTAIPSDDWRLTFMKCVFNAVRLIDRLAPPMQARGWGRIINISSVAGLEPGHVPADYAAAKAALNTATMSLSTSFAQSGVTANVVSPGPILTEALAAYIDFVAGQRGWSETGSDRHTRFITEVMPLKTKRIGQPEDVGSAVAFLASPRADYITGAHLRVDGGQSVAAI